MSELILVDAKSWPYEILTLILYVRAGCQTIIEEISDKECAQLPSDHRGGSVGGRCLI
jgi:hypothetical protein